MFRWGGFYKPSMSQTNHLKNPPQTPRLSKYFRKNPVSDYPCVQDYWYINKINDVAKYMSVKELETAIMNLSVKELSELTAWLIEYRQQVWDRQIEHDLEDGLLDALLDEVDAEYEAGLAKVL